VILDEVKKSPLTVETVTNAFAKSVFVTSKTTSH
jgi:hypothetical protein